MRTLLEELTNWEERPFPRVGGSPGIGRWQCHKTVRSPVDEACDHHNCPSSNPSLACLWDWSLSSILSQWRHVPRSPHHSKLNARHHSYELHKALYEVYSLRTLWWERDRATERWLGTQALGKVHGDKQHPALFTEARVGTPVSCDGNNVLNETYRHAVSSILKKKTLIHASTWISGTMSQTDPWQTKREKIFLVD